MIQDNLKAKEASKWAQVTMALWIAGWTAFTFITGKGIAMMDIILSGIAIASSFTPTNVSIWMDKIKDIRFGTKEE